MRWRSLLIRREKQESAGTTKWRLDPGLGVNEMLGEHHPKVCRWLCWVG
jgi:hypothetical protein